MKIGFVSLGCPKNLVDGEVMLGLARRPGTRSPPTPREPTCIVVNTCAFIDTAKQESIDAILEMAAAQARRQLQAAGRDRLPGRALSRRAAGRRFRRSTPCSAPARCRRSSTRSAVAASDGRRVEPSSTFGPLTFSAKPAARIAGPRTPDAEPARPTYLYDADDAAPPHHAAALRLRQGRRRLRLHLRVLHHPDAARRVSQPRRATRSSPRRERWPTRGVKRAAAHLAGHDVLRHRSRRARRARAAAARAERRSTASSGSGCSTSIRRRSPTTCSTAMAECEKVCQYIDLPLQHASADVLQADAAAGQPRRPTTSCWRGSATACPASPCARPSSSASPARPSGLRRARGLRRRHRLRPRRRLHLLARGRHARLRAGRRRARRRSSASGANALMTLQKRIVARAPARPDRDRGRGAGRRPVAGASSWCCRAGSKARRPKSTRSSI